MAHSNSWTICWGSAGSSWIIFLSASSRMASASFAQRFARAARPCSALHSLQNAWRPSAECPFPKAEIGSSRPHFRQTLTPEASSAWAAFSLSARFFSFRRCRLFLPAFATHSLHSIWWPSFIRRFVLNWSNGSSRPHLAQTFVLGTYPGFSTGAVLAGSSAGLSSKQSFTMMGEIGFGWPELLKQYGPSFVAL